MLITTLSCSENQMNPRELEDWNFVKKSNNYLDCITFIRKYPNTTKFDSVLQQYERQKELSMPTIADCFQNCASFTIDSSGTIFYEDKVTSLDTIFPVLMHFIINKENELHLPDKFTTIDLENVKRSYSKAAFIVYYHNNQGKQLQRVTRSISGAFNFYRNYLSNSWYGEDYVNLDSEHRYFMDKLLQYRIRLERQNKIPVPPPPPPEF
ncbi:hypothetical protein SAMN05216480_10318 [Pustulibacterium marinum]|uniref:Uncharacterized protein n=2 Tax=Pustulibacterium marinum TaxID=1224947 RepID=A0A1I7G072_9FLAO|nr:hypothetical protein SAMN05216480_10318 [Pustulibacterium marinum]